jgi:hypothetical protein
MSFVSNMPGRWVSFASACEMTSSLLQPADSATTKAPHRALANGLILDLLK